MARARLILEKGDTFTQSVDWDQSSGGPPVNLTGYTVTATFTAGVTVNLAEGSGITVDDANGRIALTLTAAQTTSFTSQYGDWRLRVTAPDGTVTTLAEGLVFVSA